MQSEQRSESRFSPSIEFRVLSRGQIQMIHEASLRVLEETGVRVLSGEGLSVLKDAGAQVVKEDVVRIRPALVEDALTTAPSSITLYSRDGQPRLWLEGMNAYFGPGSDCPNILDHATGQRRTSVLSDARNGTTLCDYLSNIDFVMSMAWASDVPVDLAFVHEFGAMVRHTTKPILFTVQDVEGAETVHEIASLVAGGDGALRERPFAVLYCNYMSPLTHNSETVDKMIWWARQGLPTIYIGGPSSGATAPVTLAGMLVQSNAEVLSGLVMSQLVCPGAPFVYGGMMHPMDMKTTLHVYGGPEMPLANAALAEMARFYQLPSFGGAGCTDAITPDAQAAVDVTVGCLVAALSGTNIIHDVGYIEAGLTQSFEMVVLSNEVIDMVRWLLQGIPINDDTLAVDVIGQVGPGGHFLQTEHTLRHFRQEIWQPILMNRDYRSPWLEKGGKEMRAKLRKEVQRILETHQAPPLDKDVDARIEDILAEQHDRRR